MLTFLFWNLGGKSLQGSIAKFADWHQVDVLILAECGLQTRDLLPALNRPVPRPDQLGFRPPDANSLCDRVVIYPRFPGRFLKLRSESSYYSGRVLNLPGRESLILFAVHLGSKLYKSETSQSLAMPGFSQAIRDVEQRTGHARTVIVGDLNMNPFESGIVAAEGLNAAMTRETAAQIARRVGGRDYPFFYNPMWSHFGDSTHEVHPVGSVDHAPPGTCYHPAAESHWYYWNLFDQVLRKRPVAGRVAKQGELRRRIDRGSGALVP